MNPFRHSLLLSLVLAAGWQQNPCFPPDSAAEAGEKQKMRQKKITIKMEEKTISIYCNTTKLNQKIMTRESTAVLFFKGNILNKIFSYACTVLVVYFKKYIFNMFYLLRQRRTYLLFILKGSLSLKSTTSIMHDHVNVVFCPDSFVFTCTEAHSTATLGRWFVHIQFRPDLLIQMCSCLSWLKED